VAVIEGWPRGTGADQRPVKGVKGPMGQTALAPPSACCSFSVAPLVAERLAIPESEAARLLDDLEAAGCRMSATGPTQ
jgi:hypothetical protein